jgi:DNA-binding NarL/FixJ family response regulator
MVLADDHEMVRRAFIRNFREQGINVIQDAASGAAAIEAAVRHAPDIVVLDLSMPGMNGFEAIHTIVEKTKARVMVLTGREDSAGFVVEAIRAGARGFVLKMSSLELLFQAIERIMLGETFIDPAIAGQVLSIAVGPNGHGNGPLSARELQVLSLVGTGADNDAIAARLEISPQTVRTHVQNVMKHLRIRSRIDLALYAICEGLVSLADLRSSFSGGGRLPKPTGPDSLQI